MARARRAWGPSSTENTLSFGILKMVGEEADATLTEPSAMRELFNQEMDLRALELLEAHEGFGRWIWTDDLTKDEPHYQLPDGIGRVLEVRVKVGEDPNAEWSPVFRAEKLFVPTPRADGVSIPTCRMMSGYLELDPPPRVTQTDGLKVIGENLWSRITDDAHTIPSDWPIYAESLLQLDTALAMLGIEEAMEEQPDRVSDLLRRRARYEQRWLDYIETYHHSPQFAVRFNQGA